MEKPSKDYVYMRAWAKLMPGMRNNLEDRIDKAREINAPQDTLFLVRHEFGGWEPRVLSDLCIRETREKLEAVVRDMDL